MKGTAFEAPAAVVTVTWAEDAPLEGGTVTVHVVCAGQLVDVRRERLDHVRRRFLTVRMACPTAASEVNQRIGISVLVFR